MNAWKIICATLVIFVAGIITGASLMRFAQGGKPFRPRPNISHEQQPEPPMNRSGEQGRPRNPNPPSEPEGPGQPGLQSGVLSRQFVLGLDRQLQLTTEQRERVEKIMSDGQDRIRQIRARSEPEIRKEMQTVHEQIKSVLTPEQQQKFERINKQRLQPREESGAPDRRFRDPRNSGGFRNQPPAPTPPPADEPAPGQ